MEGSHCNSESVNFATAEAGGFSHLICAADDDLERTDFNQQPVHKGVTAVSAADLLELREREHWILKAKGNGMVEKILYMHTVFEHQIPPST